MILTTLPCAAAGYHYEARKSNGHVIHIVTFDPSEYQTKIVKASRSVFGREAVNVIAERSKADIAINAGFFEIGDDKDGLPSGTLVIDGKIYGLGFDEHEVLKIDAAGALSIETIKPAINLRIADRIINIKKVNRPAKPNEPVLYTSAYGRALAGSAGAIVFNQFGVAQSMGSGALTPDNYTVLLPAEMNLEVLDKHQIRLYFADPFDSPSTTSLVWGTPRLIMDGEIYQGLEENNYKAFYKLPHARTAFGIKRSGEVVIVVAENSYKAMDEEKAPEGATAGLTILSLASLMKDLSCYQAINLDGGGSSTLWIKGKIVNKTIGDEDESGGKSIIRPVSDAIIFRKKEYL